MIVIADSDEETKERSVEPFETEHPGVPSYGSIDRNSDVRNEARRKRVSADQRFVKALAIALAIWLLFALLVRNGFKRELRDWPWGRVSNSICSNYFPLNISCYYSEAAAAMKIRLCRLLKLAHRGETK